MCYLFNLQYIDEVHANIHVTCNWVLPTFLYIHVHVFCSCLFISTLTRNIRERRGEKVQMNPPSKYTREFPRFKSYGSREQHRIRVHIHRAEQWHICVKSTSRVSTCTHMNLWGSDQPPKYTYACTCIGKQCSNLKRDRDFKKNIANCLHVHCTSDQTHNQWYH